MIIPEKWDDNFEALARPPSHIQIPGLSSHMLNRDMYPVVALSHYCIDPNSFEKSVASLADSDSSNRLQHMLWKVLPCVLALINPTKGPNGHHWRLEKQESTDLFVSTSRAEFVDAMAPTIRSKVWRAPSSVKRKYVAGWERRRGKGR